MTWAKKKKGTTKKKSVVGTTKHAKPGVHGRGRHGPHGSSPLATAAKADAWKHRFMARRQG